MTAWQVLMKLRTAARKFGSTVVEDTGNRGTRIFQVVAQDPMQWKDGDLSIVVEVACAGPESPEFNRRACAVALNRIKGGLKFHWEEE